MNEPRELDIRKPADALEFLKYLAETSPAQGTVVQAAQQYSSIQEAVKVLTDKIADKVIEKEK